MKRQKGLLAFFVFILELALIAVITGSNLPSHFFTERYSGIRCPAEFEDVSSVVISWSIYDWYTPSIFKSIIRAVNPSLRVVITVNSEYEEQRITNTLNNEGLMLSNVSFLRISTNSSWIRDYCPVFFYTESDGTGCMDMFYYPDRPDDDAFSSFFADANGMVLDTLKLFFEGGNLMFNGEATAITTKKVYSANPLHSPESINNQLKSAFGLTNVIALDNLTDDETGHVDMFAKFIDRRRILLSEVFDTDREDREILETNAMILSTTTVSDTDGFFEVIRLPMGVYYRSFPPGWVYHTYTNSLILNRQVFVPYYGTEYDSIAFEIYRRSMPDYEIIGINCNAIINTGGAVHCLAVGVPANMPGIREGHVFSESERLIEGIYPNPFNEITDIRLLNPDASLTIIDVNGKFIKDINGSSGIWDGRDSQEEKLPSGTYFVIASYQGKRDFRRVVLIR